MATTSKGHGQEQGNDKGKEKEKAEHKREDETQAIIKRRRQEGEIEEAPNLKAKGKNKMEGGKEGSNLNSGSEQRDKESEEKVTGSAEIAKRIGENQKQEREQNEKKEKVSEEQINTRNKRKAEEDET